MSLSLTAVVVEDRMRQDLGDIDALANSIREFGLIQPLVIAHVGYKLVAGGRRYFALKRMGVTQLEHGKHFLWNTETDGVRLKAIELEENIRRKDLTWQEQVRGKQQLLEVMQQLYGQPTGGRPKAGTDGGFGVNKLAAMLGESVGAVSQDLQVAEALKQFPMLSGADTKGSALGQLKVLGLVAALTVSAKAIPRNDNKLWTLHEWDFINAQVHGTPTYVDSESVDLIWTDLPYGADVDQMSAHAQASQIASFDDSKLTVLKMLEAIAKESYRVLKPDRYAVFCFGFVTYSDLVDELTRAGFNVNPVPVVWAKNTKSGENPNTRYCNSYEPILVAAKGSPVFIRPGQPNVITIPVEQGKLQAVQKPVVLVERFLLDMVTAGATVVDWCAGTGTTGVAAHKLNMRSIMFEKDPSMAALARARLESLT